MAFWLSTMSRAFLLLGDSIDIGSDNRFVFRILSRLLHPLKLSYGTLSTSCPREWTMSTTAASGSTTEQASLHARGGITPQRNITIEES